MDDIECYRLLKENKVRHARTFEEYRIDLNHYANGNARAFYQTSVVIVMLLGSLFGIYAIAVRTSHHWGEIDANVFAGIFGFVLMVGGIYISISTAISFFVQSYDVYLGPQTLFGKGIYGQMKQIAYSDIESIVQPVGKYTVGAGIVITSRTQKPLSIVINGAMEGFGEMVERLLEKAESVEDVKLTNGLINYKEAWKKEPDWELINRAKSRAEENKKKNEKNRGAMA